MTGSGGSSLDPGGGAPRGAGDSKANYAAIASLNTSVRDKKNLLEIRLERRDLNIPFNLSQEELDYLLVSLGIDSSHFLGVSCCPEGKGVVYVTLNPAVNIQRFLKKNECFEIKDGIRTSFICPGGKKELSVTISGLHPNTKDQAVIRYLSAHGKVSSTDKIIHHVFPGAPGTSVCAGKLNGNRTFMVEIKKTMGTYHIIDGEKVSIKYRGQDKTCARCHCTESICPGKAMARDCTAERVLLSDHMKEHWAKVGYKPDTQDLTEVDELDVQVGREEVGLVPVDSLRPDHRNKYTSVLINGFPVANEKDESEVYQILLEGGLPSEYKIGEIQKNKKNGQLAIENLDTNTCVSLSNFIHGKQFFNRKVYVTPVVGKPPKDLDESNEDSSGSEEDSSESEDNVNETKTPKPTLFTPFKESCDTRRKDQKNEKIVTNKTRVRSSSRQKIKNKKK